MGATRDATIYASFPFGLILTDREGRVVLCNPAAVTLFESLAQWTGRPLAAWLEQAIADPAQALCWTVALTQALAQAHTTYLNLPVDLQTGPAGGKVVSVMGVVAPWRDEQAEPVGAVVILQDHAQYRHLAELRTRFFSVISHELGSPVTNIAAAADLLAQQLAAAPLDQQRLVQIVQDEASRFRRLMGQFLSTSAQAGALRPARSLVTLRPLLNRVLQTYSVRATGHRFVLKMPLTLPFVEGDADRIHEVLCNLIDNATRYSPSGTTIVLAAEEWPREVVLSVTDQGIGLPAGEEDRIFEPFYRGVPAEQDGQGVGLYIARNLVRAMGGELWHERQPGGSARFCFTLLRAQRLDEPEGGEEDDGQDPDCRG